ncbi:MAG: RHS repeat-associated core domain-containing protein, partial [Planctomycetaceae bacterium]|nr:RHS repeat-associated core domain-containing protein [Planctomycetaceae bacterium]
TVKNGTEQEYYFTFDGHGSTRVLTDLAGAIVELYAFDAYGNAISFDPSVALTEFLYSGEQFDSKIGQQYLRARYYNPATGRFNQLDPFFGVLIEPLSFNKYLYAHSDPISNFDPSGENIGVAILVVAFLALLILALRCTPQGNAILLGLRSEPMGTSRISSIASEIKSPFGADTRMNELANLLEEKTPKLTIYIIPKNSRIHGANFAGDNRLYIAVNENDSDLVAALIIFTEYQHSKEGGKMTEEEAQEEFEIIQQKIPENLQTEEILKMHHK